MIFTNENERQELVQKLIGLSESEMPADSVKQAEIAKFIDLATLGKLTTEVVNKLRDMGGVLGRTIAEFNEGVRALVNIEQAPSYELGR